MKSKIKPLILLMSLFFGYACLEDRASGKQYLVIRNGNVITMESDTIIPNQIIVIQDRFIKSIGPEKEITIPKGAHIIDAQGKFIIPGLSDMHMHIDHPDILKLNLAYGITTVMNYRGLQEHLIYREKAANNEFFSPSIYTTGDYMEGYPATMPGFLSFDNADEARQSVRDQKEKGYDFIKVYRNLDTVLHQAICDEATKNELTVVGHLSPEISLKQSLAAGQKVIAHAEELMYYFNNENDTTKIEDLVNLLKEYQVTYTPNLTIFRSLFLQVENIDSLNNQDYLKYLQPALFQSWRLEYNYNHYRGIRWAKFMRDRFGFLQEVTKNIQEADIPILTSTDAPTSGAFPGIAVHNELTEFVEIGFTPYQALRTATVEPGKFMKNHIKDAENFGIIKEGYRADLLLLETNPLENIKNTRSIAAVVKNGTYYSGDAIAKELEKLNQIYEEVDQIVRSIEKEISDEKIDSAWEIYSKAKSKFPDQLFLGYYTMWYEGYKFLYEDRALTENMERAELALKFYQMYLNDYPEMHGSHYLIGMAHKAKKDTLNATKSFEESLKLHPYNPYSRLQLNKLKDKIEE